MNEFIPEPVLNPMPQSPLSFDPEKPEDIKRIKELTKPKKKIHKANLLIAGLLIATIILGSYVGYMQFNNYKNDLYAQGFNNGIEVTHQVIAVRVSNQGFYTLPYKDANNETLTAKIGVIQ